MYKRLLSIGGVTAALIALIAGLLTAGAVAAQTNPTQAFAHPAFQRVWTRTDQLVQQGQAGRSWFWGPQPAHGRRRSRGSKRPAASAWCSISTRAAWRSTIPTRDPNQRLLRHQRPADRRTDLGQHADRRQQRLQPAHPRLHHHLRRLRTTRPRRPMPASAAWPASPPASGARDARQARPGRDRRPLTATAPSATTPARAACPA